MGQLCGVVLAAGAGRRAGGPKALRRSADATPWVAHAASVLLRGGCDRALVVLGAGAAEARPLVPADPRIDVVVADDWADGMAASLMCALDWAARTARAPVATVITLVDLPGLPVSVVERVLATPVTAATVRHAVYGGRSGHPVVIGRDHWAAVRSGLGGDRGAREYLLANSVENVECSDLFDGGDEDSPPKSSVPRPT